MLNHSCDVTALKLVLVFFEKAMIFIATTDLDKGEELCREQHASEEALST